MSLAKSASCKICRIGLILGLAVLLSASTCTGIVDLIGCPDANAQIRVLSPNPVSADMVPVVLSMEGTGFVPHSEIQWNNNPLPTRFIDARHLQATVTQQTLDSSGISAGGSVMVSVLSPGKNSAAACTSGGSSSTLILEIN